MLDTSPVTARKMSANFIRDSSRRIRFKYLYLQRCGRTRQFQRAARLPLLVAMLSIDKHSTRTPQSFVSRSCLPHTSLVDAKCYILRTVGAAFSMRRFYSISEVVIHIPRAACIHMLQRAIHTRMCIVAHTCRYGLLSVQAPQLLFSASRATNLATADTGELSASFSSSYRDGCGQCGVGLSAQSHGQG